MNENKFIGAVKNIFTYLWSEHRPELSPLHYFLCWWVCLVFSVLIGIITHFHQLPVAVGFTGGMILISYVGYRTWVAVVKLTYSNQRGEFIRRNKQEGFWR